MNFLTDIITYVRRLIKSPSDSVISDNLIIDYINRFWILDVDARVQLFDLKTKYQFITSPGVDQYNMPLYNVQTEPGMQTIGMYPVYQGFLGPAYINGIQVPLYTEQNTFYNFYPNVIQNLGVVAVGNGTTGPYTLNLTVLPATAPQNPPFSGVIRGHVDITGIVALGTNVDPPTASPSSAAATIAAIPTTSVNSGLYLTSLDADGNNVIVADSGVFLESNVNCGLLMVPGQAPFGNTAIPFGAYSATENVVNYFQSTLTTYFPVAIPAGNNINAQCFYFQSGLPRGILFYNNTLVLRSPPDTQYRVELDAYLSPAGFLSSAQAIQFAYMTEYIARGAARKILSDTGDIEQFMFYEPLFREQENLVWKRSQRQFTATRTQTIYSQGTTFGQTGFTNQGGGSL